MTADIDLGDNYQIDEDSNGDLVVRDGNGNTVLKHDHSADEWQAITSLSAGDFVATSDGTAADPVIEINDADSGLFRPAADQLGIALAGAEVLSLTGSTETNDGMTANPETATEDAFLELNIGANSYQIPLYTA